MAEEEEYAEFQALQREFAGHAAEVELQRQEFYKQLDELGEAEVDRRLHSGKLHGAPGKREWSEAWLREQKTNRESRALAAAEATADAATSSARSAKVAARWAIWASVIALLAIVWSVWGSQ